MKSIRFTRLDRCVIWICGAALLAALIACGGSGGGGGGEIALSDPASILMQPKSATVAHGASVAFTVSARGDDLKYQWRYMDANAVGWTSIAGATFATYEIPKVDASMDGRRYQVLIYRGVDAAVFSDVVTLTVEVPVPKAQWTTTLAGVAHFQLAQAAGQTLGLASCSDPCTRIDYRELSAAGALTAPATVEDGWDRETGYSSWSKGPAQSEFRLVYDDDAVPHVFWGKMGDVFHGWRQGSGSWLVTNETAAMPERVGRLIAPAVSSDGRWVVATVLDYEAYGPYIFSTPVVLRGTTGAMSVSRPGSVGEYIYALDLSLHAEFALLAIDQRQWGGWQSFQIAYDNAGIGSHLEIRSAWSACISPLRIVTAVNGAHAVSCGRYVRLGVDPTAHSPVVASPEKPVGDAVDIVVDEADVPYFLTLSRSGDRVALVTQVDLLTKEFVVGEPPQKLCRACGNPAARALRSREHLIISYVTDDKHLVVKRYNFAEVAEYLRLVK